MHTIDLPIEKKFYIYTDIAETVIHYGEVQITECLSSGMAVEELFNLADKSSYDARLVALGVVVDEIVDEG